MSASITQEKMCAQKRHINNSMVVEWHYQQQHPTTIKNSSHNRTRHIKAAKAGADLKNCKANCLWKKRKNDLITAAKKKAKDSCAKGEAPDVNEFARIHTPPAKTL